MERSIVDGVPSLIGGRYAIEISVCQEMGWTYADLLSTPADMVDEIIVRMNAQNKAESKRMKIQAQRQSKGKR